MFAMVLFAVDGGPEAGYGHVGRCLAISEELTGAVAFRVFDDGVGSYLRQRGVAVIASLAVPPGCRVIVLDRAGEADPEELGSLRATGTRIALVDDSGPGRALADLVVDPPTGHAWPAAAGRRLNGFRHALIRREIREAKPDEGLRTEVLISLGASDPTASTPGLLCALRNAGVSAKAVLGPGYSGPPIKPVHRIEPRHWPAALASTRLLVTRFGHTLLEAACLGVPAIAIACEARDRADAGAFAVHGTARAVMVATPQATVDAVADLLSDEPAQAEMARTARGLVDGLGGRRVAKALLEIGS